MILCVDDDAGDGDVLVMFVMMTMVMTVMVVMMRLMTDGYGVCDGLL